ncbi:unnamed protein product [Rhizopus microsporus]
MSVSSRDSVDYRFDVESINHPSIDRDFDGLLSLQDLTKSRIAYDNKISDKRSTQSEPILKGTILTEEELARHNSLYEESFFTDDEEEEEEGKILQRVEERCELLKQEFEARMKNLEEQITKTEQGFSQSRCDIEELQSLEREYVNQGIQTDLKCDDVQKLEEAVDRTKELESEHETMQQFVDQTKKIVWDTPYIPISSICRQIPTSINEDDICDYHRQRIEALKLKSEKEKALHKKDNQSTLNKLMTLTNSVKQSSLLQ